MAHGAARRSGHGAGEGMRHGMHGMHGTAQPQADAR
jgi:hypothetical protein